MWACQTSANSAPSCSRSGTLATTLCLAASRSSHTAIRRSCGHALTVQQDTLMSGRLLCKVVQEAPNVHIVKGNQFVSTAHLLPRDLDKKKSRNNDKNETPEQTLASSNFRAEWKCPACSHEWQGQVAGRVRNDCGCPHCNKTSCIGNKNSQPTFEAAQHQLLLEWDYERNAADGIHPNTTTLGSKQLVHWVCHNCPKGQLHLYQMTASNRTRRTPSGCPYCSGRQAFACKVMTQQSHQSGTLG